MKTYIGIITVKEDEFISKKYLVNYINIGRLNEQRMDDLKLDRIKMINPYNNKYCFESPLLHCIFYTEEETLILKKYHPDILILPSQTRLDKLNRKLYDMDVSKAGLYRFLQ